MTAATRSVITIALALSTATIASAYPTRQSGPRDRLSSSISSLKKSPTAAFTLFLYLAPSINSSSSTFRSAFSDADRVESTLPKMYPAGTYRGAILPDIPPGFATITAAGDLMARNPALDAALESYNPLDLAPHSIYRPAFEDFSLKFTPSPETMTYAPVGTAKVNPSLMSYFTTFEVDARNIARMSQVNFDRASEEIRAIAADPDFLAFQQDARP